MKMNVKIGSARIDENGSIHGGKAGDQTGKEVSMQDWYLHSKGWRVFRAKDRATAKKIADCMKLACANGKIGYDQHQRNSLYEKAKQKGFDVSRVTEACETDCSALVRVCCAYAGIDGVPADFRTANMAGYLLKTGKFTEMKGDKYTRKAKYLGAGDILVTKVSGHTVVVVNDGSAYEAASAGADTAIGARMLENGCEGDDVKAMQEMLIVLGYDLGAWGADGDFGDCTEMAVRKFQKDSALQTDGICGEKTLAALMKAVGNIPGESPQGEMVEIAGGNCYVRSAPDTRGDIIGVAKRGEKLPWAWETSPEGWQKVKFGNSEGWVSGRYGRKV